MEDQHIYFEPSPGMYRFFEGIEDDDSGVEDLPFTNYVELDDTSEKDRDMYSHSVNAGTLFDQDEDELSFIDDDKDEDYKPRTSNLSKRGHTKLAKRRQYPNTSVTGNKMLMQTPEKQIISQCDTDSNSSMRHYARKDRTPNTIKKMMERHRESERVRHHSLNESLKDVCMRVPGYDPGAKETKVIQMQRIIGYECFLENTFRALCEQLTVPSNFMQKLNTQFISDAMNSTPMEDFYQPSNYRTSDADDDEDDDERPVTNHGRRNTQPPGRRLSKSCGIEDPRISKYRREKISSPTVDSTTDNNVRLGPLYHTAAFHEQDSTPKYITQFDCHRYWSQETGFKPIESSQESGIKVETQSSLDDDSHFHEINNLIEEGLYSESEHLRTVTPSFMREETVSTSTCMEDTDEGFDLSSPVRYRDTVFLHSPSTKGIWHSASKHHLPDKADTPGHKEMESVSPENILETKPKIDAEIAATSTSAGFHSTIRPMTEILTNQANNSDFEYTEHTVYPLKMFSNTHQFTPFTASGSLHSKSDIDTNNKTKQLNISGKSHSFKTSTPSSAPSSISQIGGKVIKTIPVRNVKIQIVHASPSQRNLQNKLMDASSVSSTSAVKCFKNISNVTPKVVHVNPELYDQTPQNVKKENYNPVPENHFAVTQLKRIPVPVMTTLQEIPVPMGSPLQCTAGLCSPEMKNKRKRYTPFRSPFLDRTNQDSDDDSWPSEQKKVKLFQHEDVFGGAPRMLTRSRGETTDVADDVGQCSIRNSEFIPGYRKIDHRRSTWMNGFMMFSQINRQKYLREHPGTHVSVIQKLLGQMWRNMTHEEQLPYREKASQYSGYIKQAQACTASIADSSTSFQGEDREPEVDQSGVEPTVLTIAPEYWQFS
ncbi:uncharacterized protein LOC123545175 [Mercenaria mercenaria]|uniref:uncharacterized protein LOC123545175 n=1 Tax=Mercenaria mercenaria TaxID=6596 RepID=UPI00234F9AC5|nr:uncharacterized protein LOC123545175 [Mercenaria mercenaria]